MPRTTKVPVVTEPPTPLAAEVAFERAEGARAGPGCVVSAVSISRR